MNILHVVLNANDTNMGYKDFYLSSTKDDKKEVYCSQIINKGFSDFIENQITQHDRVYDLPIHFVGSISYLLQDELKKALKSFRLNTGSFIQKPIDDLVQYHLKY